MGLQAHFPDEESKTLKGQAGYLPEVTWQGSGGVGLCRLGPPHFKFRALSSRRARPPRPTPAMVLGFGGSVRCLRGQGAEEEEEEEGWKQGGALDIVMGMGTGIDTALLLILTPSLPRPSRSDRGSGGQLGLGWQLGPPL